MNAAIASGRTDYVQQVLSLYGFDENTPTPCYWPCLRFLKDEPLRMAVQRYNRETFDLLLAVSDPILRHDTMLDAVIHNSAKCVAHLIDHTNSDTHTVALYNAVRLNHTKCIDALLPYGDLPQVLIWVNQNRHSYARDATDDSIESVRNEMKTQRLRTQLEDVSSNAPSAPRKRKM